MSPLVLLRHLLWILCLFTPKSVSALPLHLIAVFPQEGDTRGGNALARALRKAVSDSDSGLFERDVTLLATPIFSPRASQPLLVNLCNALKRQQPPPAALVSFVGPPLSFYVSLLGSHMKVPVLGMTRSYEDRPAKRFVGGISEHPVERNGSPVSNHIEIPPVLVINNSLVMIGFDGRVEAEAFGRVKVM
ncbi:hypothetical protein AVEN_220580-1 [Araneus ventricosus]|uniref:Receptor ligand binding region domain-containing protein n=1 Tax=Araneus ventricosus TaxID=182803 RepID=A0A4Y2M3D6_ARAVE|nr:hypothetical protein AVEN_220580-1 [Araneus ventricosus]